jgi:hypothetical protein
MCEGSAGESQTNHVHVKYTLMCAAGSMVAELASATSGQRPAAQQRRGLPHRTADGAGKYE